MSMVNLVNTNELMRFLNIGSYNTIKKLENDGVIKPIKIGRVRKWDVNQCIDAVKNSQHETA